MKTIHDPKNANQQDVPEGFQESIHLEEHESNTMDGSEFLDDNLRMKDQPLGETPVDEKE